MPGRRPARRRLDNRRLPVPYRPTQSPSRHTGWTRLAASGSLRLGRTAWGNDMACLEPVVMDDDALDEHLQDCPFVPEGGFGQPGARAGAEGGRVGEHGPGPSPLAAQAGPPLALVPEHPTAIGHVPAPFSQL